MTDCHHSDFVGTSCWRCRYKARIRSYNKRARRALDAGLFDLAVRYEQAADDLQAILNREDTHA